MQRRPGRSQKVRNEEGVRSSSFIRQTWKNMLKQEKGKLIT